MSGLLIFCSDGTHAIMGRCRDRILFKLGDELRARELSLYCDYFNSARGKRKISDFVSCTAHFYAFRYPIFDSNCSASGPLVPRAPGRLRTGRNGCTLALNVDSSFRVELCLERLCISPSSAAEVTSLRRSSDMLHNTCLIRRVSGIAR